MNRRTQQPGPRDWTILCVVLLTTSTLQAGAAAWAGLAAGPVAASAAAGVAPGFTLAQAAIGWSFGNRGTPSRRPLGIAGRVAYGLVGVVLFALVHLVFAAKTYL